MKKEFAGPPYWKLLGMELVEHGLNYAIMKLKHRVELTQGYGTFHGGAIASLADAAVAVAIIHSYDFAPGDLASTIEMKINFLAAVHEGEIFAESRLVKKGKTIAVGTVEVRNSANNLVAIAIATYKVIRKGSRE